MKGVRAEKFNHCPQKIIFKEEFDASHLIMHIFRSHRHACCLSHLWSPGLNMVLTGGRKDFFNQTTKERNKVQGRCFYDMFILLNRIIADTYLLLMLDLIGFSSDLREVGIFYSPNINASR